MHCPRDVAVIRRNQNYDISTEKMFSHVWEQISPLSFFDCFRLEICHVLKFRMVRVGGMAHTVS